METASKLTDALQWFERAVKYEAEKKDSLMIKCLDKAIALEKEGLALGEKY